MNAMRFKTPEDRVALCEAYCAHVRQGLSDDSFGKCDKTTFKKYEKDFPIEFDALKLDEARATRYEVWERLGMAGTAGHIKGFNPVSWIFNMKNRFGWRDRHDITTDGGRLLPNVTFVLPQKDGVQGPGELRAIVGGNGGNGGDMGNGGSNGGNGDHGPADLLPLVLGDLGEAR